METPILNEINTQKYIAFVERGIFPDNVMIHPIRKESLTNEATALLLPTNFDVNGRLYAFGMKVIFTDQIEENQIICTFNQKTP